MEKDKELVAMDEVYRALEGLEPEEVGRVLTWASDRFGVLITRAEKPQDVHTELEPERRDVFGIDNLRSFEVLGELFAKARPKTNADKALVSATFLQVARGNADLAAQQINNELKHLGHRILNITDAINSLIWDKPSLMIQLRKSGSTKQARKTYKVTDEGISKVLRMLDGEVSQGE